MSVSRVPGSEHTFEIGGMGFSSPFQLETTAPPMPAVQVAPATVSVVAAPVSVSHQATVVGEAKPLTAKQMLAQMKARLKMVERELVAKTELERERDQLRRLIRAAKNETDNVRRLRSAV